MKKFLVAVIAVLSLVIVSQAWAETWINDYGYYENKNEISAKDRLIGDVDNIFDFEKSSNAGGEKIEAGRYYIETKYQGGYNGTDPDYVYLDEIMGKDGATGQAGRDGIDGQDGYTPIKGVDYFDGQDGLNGADGYTPIKNVDYFDGQDGVDGQEGQDGVDGQNGQDGYTPIKGKDYVDGKDGLNGVDGKTPIKNIDYFDGLNGRDGKDVDPKTVNEINNKIDNNSNRIDKLEESQYIVGGVLRIKSTKKWDVDLFADYSTNRQMIDRSGIRFTYKVGESYTDKKINDLERRIKNIEDK
jgi:hypothetical protein